MFHTRSYKPMKNSINFWLIAILLTLITISCKNQKTGTTDNDSTGDKRVHDIWAIIEFEGKKLHAEDFSGEMPMMEININTGQVMGTDGCNRFTGGVEVQKKYLIFSNLAGTRMACPKMEVGDKITKALSGKKLEFEIKENKMSLFEQQKKLMVLKHID